MYRKQISLLLIIAGLPLYNYLFWQQDPGINRPLFAIFLAACMAWSNAQNLQDRKVQIMMLGLVVSGISIAVNGSFISYFINVISLGLLAGLIKAKEIRLLAAAGWNGFLSFVTFYKGISDAIPVITVRNRPLNKSLKFLQISIVPLLVLIVFYVLYSMSNPVFYRLTNNVWVAIRDFLRYLFDDISIERVLFLAFGLVLIGGALSRFTPLWLSKSESEANDELKRQRIDMRAYYRGYIKPYFKILALKRELLTATVLLFMVNALLLVVNIIDISWVWFDFSVPTGSEADLKQFVHEGTYILILSILLSMGILLYFFRNNLNFYWKNPLLKKLAYVWIVQNGILCISVMLRNYHYIDYHGLAYKRIGVIIFLVATLIGLITLFFKISNRKSVYYLLRINSWSVWGILLIVSLWQWDTIIARYNINHKNPLGIDTDFYLELRPVAFPLIYENMDKIEHQISLHNDLDEEEWINYTDINEFKERLDKQREFFVKRYQKAEWQSRTLADTKAYESMNNDQFEMP